MQDYGKVDFTIEIVMGKLSKVHEGRRTFDCLADSGWLTPFYSQRLEMCKGSNFFWLTEIHTTSIPNNLPWQRLSCKIPEGVSRKAFMRRTSGGIKSYVEIILEELLYR